MLYGGFADGHTLMQFWQTHENDLCNNLANYFSVISIGRKTRFLHGAARDIRWKIALYFDPDAHFPAETFVRGTSFMANIDDVATWRANK